MCTSCGCSSTETTVNGQLHSAIKNTGRFITLEKDLLEDNQVYAAKNRLQLKQNKALALNLMSSPGSGKTTLLVRTINDMKHQQLFKVIEGDQQTENDAGRIRETGAEAIQINTGKGCHLNASMIQRALTELKTPLNSVLFIENVGNLVCPAAFDLGEAFRIVILSVTEGEDKPIKYPEIFHRSDLMLLNKVDLLPYVDFDVDRCIDNARRVNPDIQVLQISATTGQGLQNWYDWIQTRLSVITSNSTANNTIENHDVSRDPCPNY